MGRHIHYWVWTDGVFILCSDCGSKSLIDDVYPPTKAEGGKVI